MYDEITKVKIAHLGQCPKEKGHCCIGCYFLIGMFVCLISMILTIEIINEWWHKDAVEKGYAYYHQTTGKWYWKGNK